MSDAPQPAGFLSPVYISELEVAQCTPQRLYELIQLRAEIARITVVNEAESFKMRGCKPLATPEERAEIDALVAKKLEERKQLRATPAGRDE